MAVKLIEFTGENLSCDDPLVIIGLTGPFYPHINNKLIQGSNKFDLENKINDIASKYYSIKFQSNQFLWESLI